MDFHITEAQYQLKIVAEKFAEEELNYKASSKSLWKKCADFGIFNKLLSKEYGGEELDELSYTFLLEGFGKGCKNGGLLLSINAHLWGVQMPLQKFGSKPLKEKYLKDLASGKLIGALAITEENSGSDISSIQTNVTYENNYYILNGKKAFITNGPIAGLFVVYAKCGEGLIALLVERSLKGVYPEKEVKKMGLDSAPLGIVKFENCFVPAQNRFGAEGAGKILFSKTMELERTFILSSQIGVMERLLEESILYARQRKQFGKKISEFQSISNRIVDMKIRLETAKLLMYKTAWLHSKKKNVLTEASMVKLYLSECYLFISEQALRIRGGYGYLTDSGIEQEVRNAFGSILYSGTSDLQRVIISNSLGL